MLIENVNGVRKASSMMKNSEFYIEVAKFVQAYTTIIANPNEFLKEIKEPFIDEKADKLTWEQFVKIAKTCDLGFKMPPSSSDLVVYYNYALEIGTINPKEKRLASVNDVADAQKHYYNFVDDAKDRAEAEYLRQKRITAMRESELANVDNKLSLIKTGNFVSLLFMMFACFVGAFGVVGFIFDNAIAKAIGLIFYDDGARYIGSAILLVVAIIIFAIFDRLYIKTKANYLKLKQASLTIFNRTDENYAIEQMLKRKLNSIKKDYKIVQAELKDKKKRFDVKHNIEVLKGTNKYYKRLCESTEEYEVSFERPEEVLSSSTGDEQEFAPIKLTKEQEENLRAVSKEAIKLEGQFDVDAYNEKFEKSKKKEKENEEKEQEQEVVQEEKKEDDLLESIDFIKSVLGFAQEQENQAENENEQEKNS